MCARISDSDLLPALLKESPNDLINKSLENLFSRICEGIIEKKKKNVWNSIPELTATIKWTKVTSQAISLKKETRERPFI